MGSSDCATLQWWCRHTLLINNMVSWAVSKRRAPAGRQGAAPAVESNSKNPCLGTSAASFIGQASSVAGLVGQGAEVRGPLRILLPVVALRQRRHPARARRQQQQRWVQRLQVVRAWWAGLLHALPAAKLPLGVHANRPVRSHAAQTSRGSRTCAASTGWQQARAPSRRHNA